MLALTLPIRYNALVMLKYASGRAFLMRVSTVVLSRLKVLIAERNLQRIRDGHKPLTIEQIAKETGLAESTITGMTTNRTRRADYDTLNTLCNYFECSPGELFEFTRDIPPRFKHLWKDSDSAIPSAAG